jgi:molecular chaperone DnaK (HSP70)/GTPase SAR1 family protein
LEKFWKTEKAQRMSRKDSDPRIEVLSGSFNNSTYPIEKWKRKSGKLMTFVSSTFTDTQREREYLMQELLPKLREFASSFSLEVTFVDMRWGVRDENTLDHLTWIACEKEILRCYEESMGLFFLSLQSQKYGYCPLPKYISSVAYDSCIVGKISDEDQRLFDHWYLYDSNSLPSGHYVLRNLSSLNDNYYWKDVFPKLIKILNGINFRLGEIPNDAVTSTAEELKIGCSVTEYETRLASSFAKYDRTRLAWMCRKLQDIQQSEFDHKWRFYDDTLDDDDRKNKLEALYSHMGDVYDGDYSKRKTYQSSSYEDFLLNSPQWTSQFSQWKAYVDSLFFDTLKGAIDYQTKWKENGCGLGLPGKEADEMFHHYEWAYAKCRGFYRREELLTSAFQTLGSKVIGGGLRLAIIGQSGCGKTAFMSKLASSLNEQQASKVKSERKSIILRYGGTTAGSTRILTLLLNVCHQIHLLMGLAYDANDISSFFYLTEDRNLFPQDMDKRFNRLVSYWISLLDRFPHIFILDSLDQMKDESEKRSRRAFLLAIPATCKSTIIVSLIPDNLLKDNEHGKVEATLKERNITSLTIPARCQDGEMILESILNQKGRTLTVKQWSAVRTALQYGESSILYIHLCSRIVAGWTSFQSSDSRLEHSVIMILNQIFDDLERNYGRELVRAVIAYITFASLNSSGYNQWGIDDNQLVEILTRDKTVMKSVNQYNTTSIFPLHVWLRLKHEIHDFLVVTSQGTWKWYHRQLIEVLSSRYNEEEKTYYLKRIRSYFAPIGIDIGESGIRAGILLEDGIHLIKNSETGDSLFPLKFFMEDRSIVSSSSKKLPPSSEQKERILSNYLHHLGLGHSLDYFPEELVARALLKVKKEAEKLLNREVTGCMISIPGYFAFFQCQAIADAAVLVGLNVNRIIPSSSMVLLADISQRSHTTGIAVGDNDEELTLNFHLGESCLEISLAIIEQQILEIKGRLCDQTISGYQIRKSFKEKVFLQFGKSTSTSLTPQQHNSLDALCDSAIVAFAQGQSNFHFYSLDFWSEGVSLDETVADKVVIDCLSTFYQQIDRLLDNVLYICKALKTQVKIVILSGGCLSFFPQISRHLKSHYFVGPSPEIRNCYGFSSYSEADAFGIAIHARQVSHSSSLSHSFDGKDSAAKRNAEANPAKKLYRVMDYLLLDGINYFMSVAIDGQMEDPARIAAAKETQASTDVQIEMPDDVNLISDTGNDNSSVVIFGYDFSPNTTVPLKKSRPFSIHHKNQTSFAIRLYEGNGKVASENMCLAKFKVSGFDFSQAIVGNETFNVTIDKAVSLHDPMKVYVDNSLLDTEGRPIAGGKEISFIIHRHKKWNLNEQQLNELKINIHRSDTILVRPVDSSTSSAYSTPCAIPPPRAPKRYIKGGPSAPAKAASPAPSPVQKPASAASKVVPTPQAPPSVPRSIPTPVYSANDALKHGSYMIKVGSFFKTHRRRWFQLTEDKMIRYYTDEKMHWLKGEFPVSAILAVSRLTEDNWFDWKTKDEVHDGVFKLKCDVPSVYNIWCEYLRKCGVKC